MVRLARTIMTEAGVDRLARLRLLIVILTVVPVAISLMMSAIPTTSPTSPAAQALSIAHHVTPPDHQQSSEHRHRLPGGVPLAVTQAAEADDQPVDWVPGAVGVIMYLALDRLLGAVTDRAPPATRAALPRSRAELQVWRA
jgi:hypothetical protein